MFSADVFSAAPVNRLCMDCEGCVVGFPRAQGPALRNQGAVEPHDPEPAFPAHGAGAMG
ncbi:MAG: hypothetical protein HRU51_10870 [Xanthomonadales bacterium]|nr:hypothetical protein [Xanthomonadales bacterium]